jgi:DNA polymerase I-like protein with 3'-5' exonuclease and polymerase domains
MNLTFPTFLSNLDPRIYEQQNFRVLDFETTAEEKGSPFCKSNRVLTWSGIDGRTRARSRGDFRGGGKELERLFEFISESDFLVCQNSKFELQWLYRLGVEPGSILTWDCMLAENCIAGNRKWELSLTAIAKRHGIDHSTDLVHKLLESGICPSEMSRSRLLESNSRDTKHTYEVFLKQRDLVSRLGLMPVVFTRCLTTGVLADIEKYGMCLDPKRVHDVYVDQVGQINRVEKDIAGFTGGVNPRSPKQVAEYLYDKLGFEELVDHRGKPTRTATGNRSTAEETIVNLRPNTDAQREFHALFTTFSGLKVAADTLKKMEACCEQDGGILRARFNQTVARNHRLSSSGLKYKLQLQNIDRSFKRLFRPRNEGWVLAAPDAPQLEFRVAGDLTNDPQVLKDVNDNFDPHLFTGHIIGRVPLEEVTDTLRSDCKPHTFKPVYGGKSGTPDQRRYYKAFNEKYEAMYRAQRGWCLAALRDKQLTIPSGLTFYWPDIEIYPPKYEGAEPYIKYQNQIFNYPVSSIATADIMQIVMVYVWYMMRGMRGFVINTVHDAVPAEIPPEEVEDFWEICKLAFTTYVYEYMEKVYGYLWTVPLGVDAKIGTHWDEGKKYKYKNADTPQLRGR